MLRSEKNKNRNKQMGPLLLTRENKNFSKQAGAFC